MRRLGGGEREGVIKRAGDLSWEQRIHIHIHLKFTFAAELFVLIILSLLLVIILSAVVGPSPTTAVIIFEGYCCFGLGPVRVQSSH